MSATKTTTARTSVKKTASAKTSEAKKTAVKNTDLAAKTKAAAAKNKAPAAKTKAAAAKTKDPAAKTQAPANKSTAAASGTKSTSAKKTASKKTEQIPAKEKKIMKDDNELFRKFSWSQDSKSLEEEFKDTLPTGNHENSFKEWFIKNKKKIIIGTGVAAVIIFLICLVTCSGVKASRNRAVKERENTLLLVQNYLDKGLYDQALDLLNGLIIKNPEDEDANELLAIAAEKKKADERERSNQSTGSYSVNIDTSDISNAMQSSIDSLKDQLASQTAENEKNAKAMNELLKQQQENAENERKQQEQLQKRQEEEAKKKAKEEAEKKAKEEELAKKNAEFKALKEKISDLKAMAKAELNNQNVEGALEYMKKIKELLPVSSKDPVEEEFCSSTLSDIGATLYDASENVLFDKDKKNQAKKAAVAYAKDTLSRNKQDAASHFILGMDYADKKDLANAEKELRNAIQSDPNDYMYFYQLGRIQAMQRKYSEARASFVSSIKINSSFEYSQYNLGFVLDKLNRTSEALQAYRKAFAINSGYENAYLAAARILVRQNDYNGAVTLFKEATRINPKNTKTYQEEGAAYSSAKKYKEAEECFRKAISLLEEGQSDPVSYYNLSTVLNLTGKNEEAVKYAKKAYETKDSVSKELQVSITYNYAKINEDAEDFDTAIPLYQEVIKLDSKNVNARVNLGKICKNLGNADTAIQILEPAYNIEPNNFEVNNNLGSSYMAKKDFDSAVKHFKKAASIEPKNVSVLTNLASSYASAKNYDDAKTIYLDIIKLDKQNYDAYFELAKICIAKKDYETAEGYILYLQEKKPDFRRDEVNALAESISASAL